MKKVFVILLVLITSFAVFANGTKEESTSGTDGSTVLRFSWWGGTERHEATLKNIERYQELHPEIVIEPEYGGFDGYKDRFYIQIAGQEAPDIAQIDFKWVFELLNTQKDHFMNLYEVDEIDLTNFDKSFLSSVCGTEDFLIGVPLGTTCYGMIYNKDFFEKFGLSDPGKWTWEDIIEMGRKVQEQDPESHLLVCRLSNFVYIVRTMLKQMTGKDMISDDYQRTYTEDDLTQAFQWVLDLVESGTLCTFEELMPYATSYPEQVPGWLDGSYGLAFSMGSTAAATIDGSQFEIGTLYLPVMEDAENIGWATTASQLYSIPKDNEHIHEAAEFVNYLLNDKEAYFTTGDTRGIPSNSVAASELAEADLIYPQLIEINEKSIELGTEVDNGPSLTPTITDLIEEYVQQVGYKAMTPREAAREYIAEVDSILEELR